MIMGAWGLGRKRLPYDAEVAYLESTGTQVIDCSVSPTQSWRIDARMMWTFLAGTGDKGVFGNYANGVLGSFIAVTGTSWYMWHGSGTGWQNIAPASIGVWHDISASDSRTSGRSFTLNSTSYSRSGNTNYLANGSRYALFAAGIDYARASMKIASSKIYIDGVLVRDFQPVRIGTEGAMYDRVSGQLFRNQGTGSFVIGPDK